MTTDKLFLLSSPEHTPEAQEALIQTLPDTIINRIRPVERLVYAGPRRKARLQTQVALNSNKFLITTIDQISSGFCLTWADGHDGFSFVLNLGRKTFTQPLHFVKVLETDPIENTVTWGYFQPQKKKFRDAHRRYCTNNGAAGSGAFKLLCTTRHVCAFDPNEIILGWDIEDHERQNVIPELQCLRAQQQIKCIQAARKTEGMDIEQENRDESDSGSETDQSDDE